MGGGGIGGLVKLLFCFLESDISGDAMFGGGTYYIVEGVSCEAMVGVGTYYIVVGTEFGTTMSDTKAMIGGSSEDRSEINGTIGGVPAIDAGLDWIYSGGIAI